MAYVTGCTSRGIHTPTINQSERDYSVRHGVHVTACVRNALCTPLCTPLHTPLHIPAHPSAHPFVHTPLHTPLHIPLCTPLCTSLHTPLCTSLHTPKKGGRSVPILLLLYNPMLLPNFSRNLFNAYKPTSSETSAPSKLPIVTSNVVGLSRFIHGLVELNKTDLRACLMIVTCSSVMFTIVLAQAIALSRSSSLMEG